MYLAGRAHQRQQQRLRGLDQRPLQQRHRPPRRQRPLRRRGRAPRAARRLAAEAELAAQASGVVGLAVDLAGDAIYWTADDHVTIRRGNPRGFARGALVSPDPYHLPTTRIGADVVAVARALDRPGLEVLAWYDDGHVSRGLVHDLRGDARPLPYRLASGQTYSDLVAVLVTPEGQAIALYRDGQTSVGTVTDLAAHATGTWTGPDPATVEALAPDGRLFVLHGGLVDITGLDALVAGEP